MFVLRLVPLFPFFVINAAAGLLGVSTRNYVLATGLGIVPGTFVYSSIGAGAGAVFDAGDELTLSGVMAQPAVLIPIVGLVALSLIPILHRRLTQRAGKAKGAV